MLSVSALFSIVRDKHYLGTMVKKGGEERIQGQKERAEKEEGKEEV